MAAKDAGSNGLRGGAFKPRTSPYSFQGLGEDGLKMLKEASEITSLPLFSEIMDAQHLSMMKRLNRDYLQLPAFAGLNASNSASELALLLLQKHQ